MVEPYTELMVDKRFNIGNECVAKRIYVVVPPGLSHAAFRSHKNKIAKLQKHG